MGIAIGGKLVLLLRRRMNKGIVYERVSHRLDADERDFKAFLEGERLTPAESKQLELIDRYHSSLLKDDVQELEDSCGSN